MVLYRTYIVPLDRNILIPLFLPFNGHILNSFRVNFLWDVRSQVLYCVVISLYSLTGHILNLNSIQVVSDSFFLRYHLITRLIDIINNFFCEGHVLNPTLPTNRFLLVVFFSADWCRIVF